jgi:hypothetical protein
MSEEMKIKLNVNPSHKLVQTGWKSSQRKGRDIDYWSYDEVDESGKVVAKYEVSEDMGIYDQKTNFSFQRTEVGSE